MIPSAEIPGTAWRLSGILWKKQARMPDWFIAVGEDADRLSQIRHSYRTAMRAYSFRYLYDGHILAYDTLEEENENSCSTYKEENVQLKNVNVNALNPAILQKFLSSGLAEEVDGFVQDYFHAIGQEPMGSLVFRNYVVLNVRFSVLSFLKKLGCDVSGIEEEETRRYRRADRQIHGSGGKLL